MPDELRTENFLESFTTVWRRVTTEPRRFFADMPVSGGLLNPLLFLLACLGIAAVGFLLIGPRRLVLWIVVIGLVRSFVGAAVLMLVARQVFGGTGDYEGTYRGVAYASAPVALIWIPFVRPLVGLYVLFLIIVGVERVHAFDATKAVLTVLLSAVAIGTVVWMLGWGHLWVPGSMLPRCG